MPGQPLFMPSCPLLSERQRGNLQAHNTRIRPFLCDLQGWFSLEAEKTGGEMHWVLRAVPQPCAVKGDCSTEQKGQVERGGKPTIYCLQAGLLPNDNYKQNTSLCKTAFKMRFLLKHMYFLTRTTATSMAHFLWTFSAPMACGWPKV